MIRRLEPTTVKLEKIPETSLSQANLSHAMDFSPNLAKGPKSQQRPKQTQPKSVSRNRLSEAEPTTAKIGERVCD